MLLTYEGAYASDETGDVLHHYPPQEGIPQFGLMISRDYNLASAWADILELFGVALESRPLREVVRCRAIGGFTLLHICIIHLFHMRNEQIDKRDPGSGPRQLWRLFTRQVVKSGAELSSTTDSGLTPLQFLLGLKEVETSAKIETAKLFIRDLAAEGIDLREYGGIEYRLHRYGEQLTS